MKTFYHGTDSEFTNYINNTPMFFTADSEYAETYCKKASFIQQEREKFSEGASIVPVNLFFSNPLVIDAKGSHYRYINVSELYSSFVSAGFDYMDEVDFNSFSTNSIASLAKDLGYDSVVIKNVRDLGAEKIGSETTDVYVVFNSNQVKSIFSN
jgi:hypothetical protein